MDLPRDIFLRIMQSARIYTPRLSATVIQRAWLKKNGNFAKCTAILKGNLRRFLRLCGENENMEEDDLFEVDHNIIPNLLYNRDDWVDIVNCALSWGLPINGEYLYRVVAPTTDDLEKIDGAVSKLGFGMFGAAAWRSDEAVMLWLLDHGCGVDMLVYENACEEDYVTRFDSVDRRLRELGFAQRRQRR